MLLDPWAISKEMFRENSLSNHKFEIENCNFNSASMAPRYVMIEALSTIGALETKGWFNREELTLDTTFWNCSLNNLRYSF